MSLSYLASSRVWHKTAIQDISVSATAENVYASSRDGVHFGPEKDTSQQDSLLVSNDTNFDPPH
jgi:hypothetical protein